MAFTGDLEHLNIVDIIQLLNSTRKSGTFSIKGGKGESRIIFSNGYIVGASHLNKVRIGTVLVKMGAITQEVLEHALEVQRKSGKERKPLIATLIEMGKLGRGEATKGLKKLIEMTVVELIGWTEGTFTLDTEAITVSPECSYPLSKMEQEISLDAQMVLMDCLRVFDERERDRKSGKEVLQDEEQFADVILSEAAVESGEASHVLTADDLGLGDVEKLERRIPQFLPEIEIHDPSKIHRRKIEETLSGLSAEDQEILVSFLKKYEESRENRDVSQRRGGRANALILFSGDKFLKHAILTLCTDEGMLVFTTEGEEELDSIIDQCLKIKAVPILFIDSPESPEAASEAFSQEKIIGLRQQVKERYPEVFVVQMASPADYEFALQSYSDGIRTVFPKPSKESGKATFVQDTIKFLEAFKSYLSEFFERQSVAPQQNEAVGQSEVQPAQDQLGKLKERILSIRNLNEPSAISNALLQYVSEVFERSVTFIVRTSELIGEKAVGLYAERDAGPTSASGLKIPLAKPSIFRDVIEKEKPFYGETGDEVLKTHLFEAIGAPQSPVIILLPMKSLGKIVTLTYGDFGEKKVSPVTSDLLEILTQESGLVLENMLYRKKLGRELR